MTEIENVTPAQGDIVMLEDLLDKVDTSIPTENEPVETPQESIVESSEESIESSPQPEREQRPRRRASSRYQNDITLRGTIAKKIEAKTVTIITMAVKANMTMSNYPTVMFFGDTRKQANKFNEGDRVYVKSTLQSYDEKKLRKGQSTELIIGKTIIPESAVDNTPVPSAEGEFELKPIENAYCNDENKIELRGQILAIECLKGNNVNITIRTVVDGRMSIVKYPYYARNADSFLKQIYVHQFVRAVGAVQTANIPVETTDVSQYARARMIETATSIREPDPDRRLRTHKQQFYILYDVYAVN